MFVQTLYQLFVVLSIIGDAHIIMLLRVSTGKVQTLCCIGTIERYISFRITWFPLNTGRVYGWVQ